MNEALKNLDSKMTAAFGNARHATEASNGVFMAAMRNNVDLAAFLEDISNETSFDVNAFSTASKGNLSSFIKPEYSCMVAPLVDITAGGNGGMASIGRGEFFVFFVSNQKVELMKNGCGDLLYPNNVAEEVKHNGGKLAVLDRAGKEVFDELRRQAATHNLPTDIMPMRRRDAKLYDTNTINRVNALFCNVVCGTSHESLSENEMKLELLSTALTKSFEHSDTLLVINESNDFVRFTSVAEAMDYYTSRVDTISFELRANQSNPVAFYCHV